MKRLEKNIAKIVLCSTLLLAGCSQNEDFASRDAKYGENEGSLKLEIALNSEVKAKSGSDWQSAILENSQLKIKSPQTDQFDPSITHWGVIRQYSPATDVPGEVLLQGGDYMLTLAAGEEVAATFEQSERVYYGEEQFAINRGEASEVTIDCKMKNSVVKVVFDQSAKTKFDQLLECHFSASDVYDSSAVETIPSLCFNQDNEGVAGYFLLPEGVSNISWGIKAGSSTIDYTVNETITENMQVSAGATSLTAKGAIENPAEATLYTLTFSYGKTPDGYMGVVATVDKTTEDFEDNFTFTPQVIITGVDFDLGLTQNLTEDNAPLSFTLSANNPIVSVALKSDNTTAVVKPFVGGSAVDVSKYGVVYIPDAVDPKLGEMIVSKEYFFKNFGTGENEILIEAFDSQNSRGTAELMVNTPVGTGIIGEPTNIDTWFNKAQFNAEVYDTEGQDVKFEYRVKGETVWNQIVAAANGDGSYSATVLPEWNTLNQSQLDRGDIAKSGSHTVYTLKSGIRAATSYEYRLLVADRDYATQEFATATANNIPNGDFESGSIAAWSTSGGSGKDWSSGNNTWAKSLCSQVTLGGSKCAKLTAGEALKNLTAGNVFFGNFDFSGTSGTVRFGQAFEWNARPKAMKLRYAATIGDVDIAKVSTTPLSKGDKDYARIYVAIVDWGSQHKVSAGTSGKPDGSWDPETDLSVSTGNNVIGYGSYWLQKSTTTTGLHELEIPIYYYDTATKPSKTYTLVVSAATSAYGDFMVGCSSNVLWVDDIQLVY